MKGKCCEGFSPLGLVLVPAGELTTADLKLRSFANSEIRQDSSTPHLICGVEYLVRCLSEFAPLEPGGTASRPVRRRVSRCPGASATSVSVTSWRSRSRESGGHVRCAAAGARALSGP